MHFPTNKGIKKIADFSRKTENNISVKKINQKRDYFSNLTLKITFLGVYPNIPALTLL
jgi:hypothetical protein